MANYQRWLALRSLVLPNAKLAGHATLIELPFGPNR